MEQGISSKSDAHKRIGVIYVAVDCTYKCLGSGESCAHTNVQFQRQEPDDALKSLIPADLPQDCFRI